MAYYNSPNPIYEFHYTNFITNDPFYIGKDVKVVKGRKYPIGAVYKIKFFWTYYIDRWNKTDYAIMESGEKINISNLELVKPKINYHIKESWYGGRGDL